MADYFRDHFRAQERPVSLCELVGLNPKPVHGYAGCKSWDETRDQARARCDYAAAAVASEETWRHQLSVGCHA